MFEVMLGGGKSGPDLSKFTLKGVTTPITAVGVKPKERRSASFVVHANVLYMFNGYSDTMGYLSEMWKLDLTTYIWEEVTVCRGAIGTDLSFKPFVKDNIIYYIPAIPKVGHANYYAYTPDSGELEVLTAIETNAADIGKQYSSVLINDDLYMVGGTNHFYPLVLNLHKLNLTTRKLTRLPPGRSITYQQTGIDSFVRDNKIYTSNPPDNKYKVDVYDLTSGTWSNYLRPSTSLWTKPMYKATLDNGEIYHLADYNNLHYFDLTNFDSTEIGTGLFEKSSSTIVNNWGNKLIAMINGDPSKLHVIT